MREMMSSDKSYRRQITQLNSEMGVGISYFLGRNTKPAIVQAFLRYLVAGFQDCKDLETIMFDSPDSAHI